MYADLMGNHKKQGIKSLCDNNVKKKPKLIQEMKDLFYKKGLELGTRKELLDYVWDKQFSLSLGLSDRSSKI